MPNRTSRRLPRRIPGAAALILALSAIACAGPRGYSSNLTDEHNTTAGHHDRSDEVGDSSPGILHVASQNLLHDYPKYHKVEKRLSRLIQEIKAQDLDIIGFQEASWITSIGLVPRMIAEQLGYHYVFFVTEGAGRILGFLNGMAIVSRYPIVEHEILTFSEQRGRFEGRSVIRALIETPYGPINFYSTHLSGTTDLLNLKQTRELTAFIDQHRATGPSFIAGDFNFHPDDSAERHLAAAGFVDTFTTANPARKTGSCCTCIEANYFNSFDPCPEQSFLEAIDRLYLVADDVARIEIVASGFIMDAPFLEDGNPLWISDHKGIQSQVRFKNQSLSVNAD